MFKKTSKKKQKTKLDDRFTKVLHDNKFKTNSSIDKYGRNNQKDDSVDELNDFYFIEEKSEDHISKSSKLTTEKKTKSDTRLEYLNKLARGEVSDTESESESVDSDTNSISNDEDDGVDEIIENKLSLIGQELNPDEEDIVQDIASTKRLAIMNCDWENVKAVDLMAILQSFCPTGKQVIRVTVYPSDLGLSQMQNEQLHGPQLWDTQNDFDAISETVYDLVESSEPNRSKSGDFVRKDRAIGIVLHDELVKRGKARPDNEDSSINDDENIDEERLRSYELRKLKYYFAIAETDSSETSDILRNNLDGIELEHSSMVLDLRVVPDDLDLHERTVRDSCDFVPSTYEPPEFIVNALQHTKVECTWEIGETQREMKLTNFSLWKNLQESDLQQYIADSDSEADNDTDKHKVKTVRKLLLGDDAEYSDDNSTSDFCNKNNSNNNDDFFLEENDVDKSLTFVPVDHTDDNKHKSEEEETVLESELRIQQQLRKKRKEKKKLADSQVISSKENTSASMEQLELLFADNDQNEDEDYDMIQLRKTQKQNSKLSDKLTSTKKKKKIEKKLKKDQSSSNDFVVDVNDSRFKPVFEGNDSKFGIDKTSHEYKETAGMKTILSSQQIKRIEREKYADLNKNVDNDKNVSVNNKIDNKLLHNIKRKFSQVN
eukprot:gene17274-22808_t